MLLPLGAGAIPPGDMPNVTLSDGKQFISDPSHLLDAATTEKVNRQIYEMRVKTSVEMVVAIPPDLSGDEIPEWSTHLFDLWKIGKDDKDNGVLLVISPGDKKSWIVTGYGMEGVLTDIACTKIAREKIAPAMKEGNLDAAVEGAVSQIISAVEDPAVAEELRSEKKDKYDGAIETLSTEVILEFLTILFTVLFIFALWLFINDLSATHKRINNYEKSQVWRNHLKTYLWLGILSAGTGLAFYLIALMLYRNYRNRRIKCPTCGALMNRLGEEEDNELLSDSQDFEEQIKSVDYDVWECPKCGTVERFPYKENQTKYTECPRCHTIAMCLVSDTVTVQPTTRRGGEGVKHYECLFCHHHEDRRYKIPKKEDASNAAIAGAIIGSALGGRGGGGGGFGGGGFGGGSTGGGGGGASW